MPPRTTPIMRPVSPLSPGYKTAQHFDSLQPPSPRTMHSRQSGKPRRAPAASLSLPALPRFHPANYPSSHTSSIQSTPDATSPAQPPMSPRSYQRMYSDAQKQLYFHQREWVASSMRGLPSPTGMKPSSPKLAPKGSPGPVTPLDLEGSEGYLVAGVRTSGKDTANPELVVDKLIRDEARRAREKTR